MCLEIPQPDGSKISIFPNIAMEISVSLENYHVCTTNTWQGIRNPRFWPQLWVMFKVWQSTLTLNLSLLISEGTWMDSVLTQLFI